MYKATVTTIPHRKQRYNTVGDYRPSGDGTIVFTVSSLGDWRMEFLITIHEMIEEALTRDRGIIEREITAFDIEFEAKRKFGDTSEPGDDPKAPYYREHQIATLIESALAHQLRVNWKDYEQRINDL